MNLQSDSCARPLQAIAYDNARMLKLRTVLVASPLGEERKKGEPSVFNGKSLVEMRKIVRATENSCPLVNGSIPASTAAFTLNGHW